MDVARINFSHGTAASRRTAALAVRQAEAASGRPVGILIDLAGPKIRLGDFAGGSIELEAGRPFALRAFRKGEPPGNATGAHVSYAALAADVQVGDRIFLADGAAELRVIERRTRGRDGGRARRNRSVLGPASPSQPTDCPRLHSQPRTEPICHWRSSSVPISSVSRSSGDRMTSGPFERCSGRTGRTSSPRSRRVRQSSRLTPSSTSWTP